MKRLLIITLALAGLLSASLNASDHADTLWFKQVDHKLFSTIYAYNDAQRFRYGDPAHCIGSISYSPIIGVIEDLKVQPGSRRKGIGTALFKAAINNLRANHPKVTWHSTKMAIPFYKRQGAVVDRMFPEGDASMYIETDQESEE